MDKENWKRIIDYESEYEISDNGVIKSLQRKVSHSRGFEITIPERILKFSKNKNGYCQVNLTKNSKQKCFKVHRLVALHFIENPNNLPDINHIDGNKENNNVNNLEWVSRRENCCHRSFLKEKKSSNFIGVTKDNIRNKWISQIRYKGKRIFLGRFDSEQEAYDKRIDFEKNNNIINNYL